MTTRALSLANPVIHDWLVRTCPLGLITVYGVLTPNGPNRHRAIAPDHPGCFSTKARCAVGFGEAVKDKGVTE